MSIISQEYRSARREHTCTACHATIRPGQRYHYSAWSDGGELYTWKSCERCIPHEDSYAGAWIRPEEAWAEPDKWPAQYQDDGSILVESYYEYEGGWASEHVQHESVMVPLVGMMEWSEVPR